MKLLSWHLRYRVFEEPNEVNATVWFDDSQLTYLRIGFLLFERGIGYKLVRFAHNWNVGILEYWNYGFWDNAMLD
jgi:hypothetical protein